MRRSLLGRLLALTGAVAVLAIAATTWIVMTSTTAAIRQQQSQSLALDAQIYQRLVRYAAGHRSWSGVQRVVRELANRTHREVILTTTSHRRLAASASSDQLPRAATATVNALSVNRALDPQSDPDGIADGVTGPYRRSAARPTSPAPVGKRPSSSVANRRAIVQLAGLVDLCLPDHRHVTAEHLLDATGFPVPRLRFGGPTLARCYAKARRRQLRPYVAPPALLYIGGTGGAAATSLDLTGSHRRRILEVALIIVLLTVMVTALAARRLVRPLRQVIRAAERMTAGDNAARVHIAGQDEVARLGQAFNELAARREVLEAQRTAMVNDVAHELRTPVSNIRGWLEATQDGLAVPDDELIASLLEEATLLTRLIEDLTDLSAAEAGELRLHPEPVDLREIAEQAAAALRPGATPAGVALAVDADGELEADPVRLRQLLGNLLSNAIRHSPPGATVRVQSRRAAGFVEISVSDEGDGIAAEDLDRIFERFWRAEHSRGRAGGGSGLGLAIVRRLAEAHGGAITVQSTIGQGSTFTVRLPAKSCHRTRGYDSGPARWTRSQTS